WVSERRPPMRRYELSDRQWERIALLFPHPSHHGKPGRPSGDQRPIVNGILWILHTGAPWRDLPERYGPWKTVWHRFNASPPAATTGVKMAPGFALSPRCWTSWTTRPASITTFGVSMAPSSGPAGQPPGRKKKASGPRKLGGRKESQLKEPPDHALGRSRGGF